MAVRSRGDRTDPLFARIDAGFRPDGSVALPAKGVHHPERRRSLAGVRPTHVGHVGWTGEEL